MSDFEARLIRQARACAGVSMATHVLTVDRDTVTFDDDVYKILMAIEHKGVREVFKYRPIKLRRAPERVGVDPETMPPDVPAEPIINDITLMKSIMQERGEYLVNFPSQKENAALAVMCLEKTMGVGALLRCAFRYYHDDVRRIERGETMKWFDKDEVEIVREVHGCGGQD